MTLYHDNFNSGALREPVAGQSLTSANAVWQADIPILGMDQGTVVYDGEGDAVFDILTPDTSHPAGIYINTDDVDQVIEVDSSSVFALEPTLPTVPPGGGGLGNPGGGTPPFVDYTNLITVGSITSGVFITYYSLFWDGESVQRFDYSYSYFSQWIGLENGSSFSAVEIYDPSGPPPGYTDPGFRITYSSFDSVNITNEYVTSRVFYY